MAEVFMTFCTTRLAILKWLQILCCTITFVFLIEGRQQWWLYSALFFVDLLLAIFTLLTLIAYFLRVQVQVKLVHLEIFFNLVALLVSLVFTGWLVYDLVKMHNENFSHHSYAPPRNIGNYGWKHRILIVTVAQVLNLLLYFLSLYQTKIANRIG